MSLLKYGAFVFVCLLAAVWVASHGRPLVVSVPRTMQEVWFLDVHRGRVRIIHQRAVPQTVAGGFTADATQLLTLRMRDGYDHSYYFISTFIDDHLRWHAQALAGS